MKNFLDRLRDYYDNVAKALRGEAYAASIFPNTTDVGMSRENVYREFLRKHAPSKCNVFFGGFLFDENGNESRQMDIIITTDTTPRFDWHNPNGSGKSFSPVEGTIAAISIKSTLDKKQLNDALFGIASIPLMKSLNGRVIQLITINNYEDWPLKIIYANDGISAESILNHLGEFYAENPSIPFYRRPNLIHVAGSYLISRTMSEQLMSKKGTDQWSKVPAGQFALVTENPDLQAIAWTLSLIQEKAMLSNHIMYSYGRLINAVVMGDNAP